LRSPLVILILLICSLACESDEKKRTIIDLSIIGGDISLLDKIEEYGGKYKEAGIEKDALEIFQNNGFNYGRLRLFHTPNMVGSVCNDLEYTIKLSKRIKESGMKLLLNLHYSDTWADPGHQWKPDAWKDLDFNTLKDSVYQYTLTVIQRFETEGVLPDMVQVGNEIHHGMLWPDGQIYKEGQPADWEHFCDLLKMGIKGVEDAVPGTDIPIMIHSASGGDKSGTENFFNNISQRGVQFDIIGQSYYPWWHGNFQDIRENIEFMSSTYDKDIIYVETAYYWKGDYSSKGDFVDQQPYPCSRLGQFDFLQRLCVILSEYPKVTGVFYWYPESVVCDAEAGLNYWTRSLFDEQGNALLGIEAFVGDD
jgi:arabinogalactan endo-1,4-beta-galactosidase